MISWRFKWFQISNCFQTTWALVQLFQADYKYILVISINDYLKSVQENSVYKEKWKGKLNFEHLYYPAILEI